MTQRALNNEDEEEPEQDVRSRGECNFQGSSESLGYESDEIVALKTDPSPPPTMNNFKVPEPRGNLRTLTKQLSLPSMMGEPLPLSPAPKKKASVGRRLSIGATASPGLAGAGSGRKGKSPNPLGGSEHGHIRSGSPGALSRNASPGSLGRVRSFRAQRKLAQARMASARKLAAGEPLVGILRKGKFSQAPAESNSDDGDTASGDSLGEPSQEVSKRRRSRRAGGRRKRVTFYVPDDVSLAESHATESSMQLMDLCMEDSGDDDNDYGRSFRDSVPFVDTLDDGEGCFGEMGLNDSSDNDLMFGLGGQDTIKEEFGQSFGDGFNQSFGSLFSDEDSMLNSIKEGDIEYSPAKGKRKQFQSAMNPPPAPGLDGSIRSLLSDNSPYPEGLDDGVTPVITNFKKVEDDSRGRKSIGSRHRMSRSPPPPDQNGSSSSIVSRESESEKPKGETGTDDVATKEEALDLSKLDKALPTKSGDQLPEGSLNSEASSESPTSVLDFEGGD